MTSDDRPVATGQTREDAGAMALRHARLEQQAMEAKLEIMRSHRQRRESTVSRRLNFLLVFALAATVAFVLDHKGCSPQISILGCVATIVLFGGYWVFRKPY